MRNDYPKIIGQKVSGKVDRPIFSHHPRHPDIIYPINYGYAGNFYAEDKEKQDVYIFGIDEVLTEFSGTVIAVYLRFNDIEDKWIVSIDGRDYPDEYIKEKIAFQEQYFIGELLR